MRMYLTATCKLVYNRAKTSCVYVLEYTRHGPSFHSPMDLY